SRLWPLSRESFPKQYLNLNNENKLSLLQTTQKRLTDLNDLDKPIIICNEDHRFLVAEQMRQIDTDPKSIILEPFGRNTAPAITIAALKALETEKDAILLVLAADHDIKNNANFIQSIKHAKTFAEQGKLVTFGVSPKSPETGYGYIKSLKEFKKGEIEAYPIDKFVEKPNLNLAKELIKDKRIVWNSGMFIFKATKIINEIKEYQPELIHNCINSIKKGSLDNDFQRLDINSFSQCSDISIDKGIMEKTNLGYVISLDAGWSDVGGWKSIWENAKKDQKGNVFSGDIYAEKIKNCYLRSEDKLVVAIGIEDLIIVDTKDALLIANKNNTEEIKSVVKQLINKKRSEGTTHKKVYRPWGNYISIDEGKRWKAKKIEVKPGAKLSLQLHHHRAEHWIVVTGSALVEVNDKKIILSENQSTYIPLGSKHRLSNPGKIPLILVEIQSGAYLDEDDIIRFEDKYGRTKAN
ncbi:mannose-1-phosphate guanylyltransferase/mannose-6-phosphate isomerase, partial [Prochlorococcus sp. AH-716-M18]|nr:mannose-1-phosphate guanylyltransferase/mannose-6-phosphate isomerase [Prochlorococcus sp. AH-716-M18]